MRLRVVEHESGSLKASSRTEGMEYSVATGASGPAAVDRTPEEEPPVTNRLIRYHQGGQQANRPGVLAHGVDLVGHAQAHEEVRYRGYLAHGHLIDNAIVIEVASCGLSDLLVKRVCGKEITPWTVRLQCSDGLPGDELVRLDAEVGIERACCYRTQRRDRSF